MAMRTTRTRTPDQGRWRSRAACRHTDPDLFFPDREGADISAAVAICAVCPVRVDCHKFAEATNQRYGIWAGMDRSAPKRHRKARPAATAA